MRRIPLHLLEAFVAFNDSKNIVEAARILNLSQPGLSKQVKQLDDFLPGKVFTTSGRKKVLTPFGVELSKKIGDRFGKIQEAAVEAWVLSADPSRATIRILGRRGILDRISRQLRFSGTISFSDFSNEAVVHKMMEREAELGIVHSFPNSSDLVAKPLFREEFRLALPKIFFKRKPELDASLVEKLMGLPFLGYRYQDELVDSLRRFYSIPMPVKIFRATESYQAIGEMASMGMGCAVLPSYIQISEATCWSLVIPSKALPSRQFYILYRPEFKALGWFRDLVTSCRECF